MERDRHNRSGGLSRSYSYVTGDTAKYSVSSVMVYLKGKSSLSIYERWGNAKFRYRNWEFCVEGTMSIPQGRILKKSRSIYGINLRETRSKVN